MNRAINILLLVVSFPALAYTIIVGFDLPIEFLRTTGEQLPYRKEVFWGFALILTMLTARRAVNRWVGVSMTRKPERFVWCVDIGAERKKQVRMYLIIEAIVAFCFAYAIIQISEEATPLLIAYILLGVDHLLYLFFATKHFRVGVSKKAIVVADREIRVLYFSGLRRVELHQQTLFFEYIQELQLSFPINCIPEGSFSEFRTTLDGILDRDKIYYSSKFKQLV